MFNKKINDLDFSKIRELNKMATSNTINLGIGRPFCETPQSIKNAAIEAINSNKTYYTSNLGIKELREVVSERYHYGNFENVLVTVGVAEAIYIAMISFLDKEDEVLIPNPGYLAYKPIGDMIGCKVNSYSLNKKYQLDFDDIKIKITNKTKMIIINNPGNPTSAIFNKSDLEKLIKIANDNNIIILSDEVYKGLVYTDEKCVSIADINMNENIIVLSGVSKEFSMTGWRVGWIYSVKENINQMVKPHLYINSCAASISQYAAYEALKNNTREVVNQLKENKLIMKYYLDKIPNINYVDSNFGLYYFIDISEYGDDEIISKDILKIKNTLTIPGIAFGSNGKGYLRLSFGANPEEIKEGMKRLIDYFINYNERIKVNEN
jgi:aspartate/methionine/tyrosine aminotransferase